MRLQSGLYKPICASSMHSRSHKIMLKINDQLVLLKLMHLFVSVILWLLFNLISIIKKKYWNPSDPNKGTYHGHQAKGLTGPKILLNHKRPKHSTCHFYAYFRLWTYIVYKSADFITILCSRINTGEN